MPQPIAQQILDWYKTNARDLPWRSTSNTYAIWVSEIMLQQTRVETVIPYYLDWMRRFPSVESLAQANQQDVLSQWEGLGYYARARNMHHCARVVVEEQKGEFPVTYDELLELPGIGPYTAAAISSFAYHIDIPAIDANLKRVLSRLFLMDQPVNDPKHHQAYFEAALAILPIGESSDFNQGMMDLGAMICLPKNPNCGVCPVKDHCNAHLNKQEHEYPKRKPAKEKPHITVTAAIIHKDDKYLITQRPYDGLLGGLWEFPGGKIEEGENLPECLKREICEELGVGIKVGNFFGEYKHTYTHFHVTLHAFECQINNGKLSNIEVQDTAWVTVGQLADYPMGKIDRSISKDLLERNNFQL